MDKEKDKPNPTLGSDASQKRVPGENAIYPADERIPVDNLIIQFLSGNASPFEEERLRRWRESSPENDEHFREMEAVWSLTAPEPWVPAAQPPSVETILARAPASSGERRLSVGGGPTRRRTPWKELGLLAASVAAIGLGIGVFGSWGPSPLAIHEAVGDESLTVTLADGSFVRLAEGATLREWEVEGRREVSLQGMGFFAVARDEARPFVVRTGLGEIQVLGTRFQVTSEEEGVETVVVEGLVQVTNALGSVQVPAGSLARMDADTEPSTWEVDDVYAHLNWPDGILVFQATPLRQVVEEVAKYFGRDIQLEGPDLSQRRVTAWFQGEAFEVVAESLCVVTEAICRTDDGTVTMASRGGGEGR